jgi:hypothetical protein
LAAPQQPAQQLGASAAASAGMAVANAQATSPSRQMHHGSRATRASATRVRVGDRLMSGGSSAWTDRECSGAPNPDAAPAERTRRRAARRG